MKKLTWIIGHHQTNEHLHHGSTIRIKERERVRKLIEGNNSWKFPISWKRDGHSGSESSKDLKQDQPKEDYSETYYNQNVIKANTKREFWKQQEKKMTHYIKGTHH